MSEAEPMRGTWYVSKDRNGDGTYSIGAMGVSLQVAVVGNANDAEVLCTKYNALLETLYKARDLIAKTHNGNSAYCTACQALNVINAQLQII